MVGDGEERIGLRGGMRIWLRMKESWVDVEKESWWSWWFDGVGGGAWRFTWSLDSCLLVVELVAMYIQRERMILNEK